MMLSMRTTVAIDDDLAREIRKQALKQKASFTRTLNRILRAGLQHGQIEARRKPPFKVEPIDVDFCAGVDPYRLKDLLVEDDTERLAEAPRDHS